MKLLEKILGRIENIFSIIEKMNVVGKLIIISLLIVSMISLKNCSGKELGQLQMEVQQTKEKAKTLSDSVVKLQTTVAEKETTIITLQFEISSKEKQKISLLSRQKDLEARRIVETDTVTIIALQDSTIDNLKGQVALSDTVIAKKDTVITQREEQIALLQTGISASNTRADLLQTQLDNVMKQYGKETKILGFIPKPTRKAAFITGLTAGVITGIVIAK